MHVDDAQNRVRVGDDVERVQREVGEAVVLPDDLDGVELGVGRRGAVEGQVEDRDVEAGEPGGKTAVGQVGVTDAARSRCRGVGPLRVLLGQLLLLDVRDDRALRVAVDHQSARWGARLSPSSRSATPAWTDWSKVRSKIPESFHSGSSGHTGPSNPTTLWGPATKQEDAGDPRDGPDLLGCRHRDVLDVLAGMSRPDEAVPDGVEIGLVGRRDGGAAQDQGGPVGRRYVRGRRRRRRHRHNRGQPPALRHRSTRSSAWRCDEDS